MPSVLLEFLFATFTALCGIAGGFYLRGCFTQRAPAAKKDDARASREALGRLREMAVKMAADVGQHNSRVQEINAELTALDAQKPEDVVAAVAKVIQANERMQEQLVQAEERLTEQARQIESHVAEARTDSLTGAANRRAFDDKMLRCVEEHQAQGRPFSLMMIDIDFFKKFNDTHGHQAGDHVLKAVARVLKQNVGKHEQVARYGGEEFAIIFPESNLAAARLMAERARASIATTTVEYEGQTLHVTASAGIAEIRQGEEAAMLIGRADSALYDSKRSGRNCAHWHDGAKSHLIKSPPKPGTPLEAVSPNAGPRAAFKDKLQLRTPPVAVLPDPPPESVPSDVITGLSTRAVFCEDVVRRGAERMRGGAPVSAMLVQIDNWTELCSRHGNQESGMVLRAVSQFLKATMRDMDHVARYDDDVFGLLLPGATLESAAAVGERLRQAVERCRLPLGDGTAQFTISLGIAEAAPADGGERLLELAAEALGQARAAGGNCCIPAIGAPTNAAAARPT